MSTKEQQRPGGGADVPSPLLLGERFLGTHCLRSRGEVQTWRGTDLSTDAPIVMKVASLGSLRLGAAERMLQEDVLLSEAQSPWLSPPLHSAVEGELFYRVTPHLGDVTLGERLARGRVGVKEALHVGRCALRALRAAHARGVLHRHLKPSNVIVSTEQPLQKATLIDFGFGPEEWREPSLHAPSLSDVPYLSPEQAGLVEGACIPSSDLYALGVVLFECLAGVPPFQGATLGDLLRQHLTVSPALRSQGLAVPRALEQVVEHLMRKDPRERYQSAEAALEDLETLASELERGVVEPEVVVGRSDRRQRIIDPAFFGRRAELDALQGAWEEACSGRGGLVLLEGESGSGKTLLLEELARRAFAQGARHLRGQGLDRVGQNPFQVLTGIFRDLSATLRNEPSFSDAIRTSLDDQITALCEAVPQLAGAFGNPEPARLGAEQLAVRRTVRALAALLDALGDATRPALVLLDDCQWADELTLQLLTTWAQPSEEALRRKRFLLVMASFRKEEVPEGHPLRHTQPTLHVTLQPFTAPDIRRLAESMAGRLPEEALATVVQLSEGNPFMAAAVVRGMVENGALVSTDSGWSVEPQRLAEVRSSRRAAFVLLRRLELLHEQARRLLVAGAILGREFEGELAAALARQSPEQAEASLREVRQRSILWPGAAPGRWVFAHDRLREALLEGLSAEESRTLHLAAAIELERQAPDRAFELAWHFEAAGELTRAWPHALAAAERARRQHALELAERYYRIADRGTERTAPAWRMIILENLGSVLLLRAKLKEAEQCFLHAQAFAPTRADQARLEGRRGDAAYVRLGAPAGIEIFQRALQLLGRRVPRSRVSFSLFALWEVLVRLPRCSQAARGLFRPSPPSEEALIASSLYLRLGQVCWLHGLSPILTSWALLRGLNLADRYAPTPDLAAAFANHGALLMLFPTIVPGVPARLVASANELGRAYFAQALALHRTFGHVVDQGHTLFLYQYALLHTARFAESIEAGHEAERLLTRAGDQCFLPMVLWCRGLALHFRGALPAAIEVGQQMERMAAKTADRHLLATALLIQAQASGGPLPGEKLAAERTRATPPPSATLASKVFYSFFVLAEGFHFLGAGDAGQAARNFLQALDIEKECLDPRKSPLIALRSWLATALREEAMQVSPLAPALRARLLRRAKTAAREELHHAVALGANHPHPLRELGLIAAIEGRGARARRYLDRSLAIAERLGMSHERALTLKARAEVGAALGWPGAKEDAAASEELLRPMRAAGEPAPEAPANLSLVDRFPRLLEAGRTIASALTREAIFTAVHEAVQGLLRGESCEFIELAPPSPALPEGLGEVLRVLVPLALERKRPVIPSQEELETAGCARVRSALCAPILARGQVVALFWVTNRQVAGAFGPEEARIAEYIATLAGAALENAQGFAEVRALSEERERLYQQAQLALRKRDEFLAVASHELRTPFTPMRLYLQGLLNALRHPARAAGLEPWVAKLELANSRLQKLARLVEELFDVSRLSQGHLPLHKAQVDLAALAAEAVERWHTELARVHCECSLEAPKPVVGHWDSLRLEQVLDNLLSNALKYGPGQPIFLSVHREGSQARLVVRDQGMGIAPQDHQRIFERFERAVSEENHGGFGLGLWISRQVVHAHGGRMDVQSGPGQGATFTIELPLLTAADGQSDSGSLDREEPRA